MKELINSVKLTLLSLFKAIAYLSIIVAAIASLILPFSVILLVVNYFLGSDLTIYVQIVSYTALILTIAYTYIILFILFVPSKFMDAW